MSMLSLLARQAFLITSPEGYTVVSYISFSSFFFFLPEETVAIFFRNNYVRLSRVRLGSFEGQGKEVSSNHF